MSDRSHKFVATLNRVDAENSTILPNLNSIVRLYNDLNGTKFRICKVGRLGKNNPTSVLYKHMIGGRTYQKIRIGDASRYDLYVQPRREGDYGENWRTERRQEMQLAATLKAFVANR